MRPAGFSPAKHPVSREWENPDMARPLVSFHFGGAAQVGTVQGPGPINRLSLSRWQARAGARCALSRP